MWKGQEAQSDEEQQQTGALMNTDNFVTKSTPEIEQKEL